MKKIEKFGIQAFDVYNNDDLVDKMIDMVEKLNEIIDVVNELAQQTLEGSKE